MRPSVVLLWVFVGSACQGENPQREVAETTSPEENFATTTIDTNANELVSVAPIQHVEPVAESGLVRFYVGDKVARSVAQFGSFSPSNGDWYSVIEVPAAMVATVTDASPRTVSLCDSANGVRMIDYVFVGAEKAAAIRPNPPDPIMRTTDDGYLVQEFRSGDRGVYGQAQVSQTKDGNLVAGISAEILVEFSEGPTKSRNGGFLIGSFQSDATVEDSRLTDNSCRCNKPEC